MAKSKEKATTEAAKADEIVTSYKGFSNDLRCHDDFQFEIGKSYEHKGRVKACEGGFHACEDPLNVLSYYPAAGSRFALVKQSGDLSRHDDDTKIASRNITIKTELSLHALVTAGFKFRFDRADWTKAERVDGECQGASATGDSGAASATGVRGAASATGDSGAASATGYSGAASATGVRGAASATGYSGAASATGYSGAASATGFRGKVLGADGCALFLVYRDPFSGDIKHAWAGIAGRDGIKPNTWYTLNEAGKPVEVV